MRMHIAIGWCVVCLALSGPVLADDPAGPDSLFDQANQSFADLDFEGALSLIDQASKQPDSTPESLVALYRLQALCLISLGREPDAERAFAVVLSLNPAFRMADDQSPRFVEVFNRVLARRIPPLALDVAMPLSIRVGDPIPLEVRLVSDPAGLTGKVILAYRLAHQPGFQTMPIQPVLGERIRLTLDGDLWRGVEKVDRPGPFEWYAQLVNPQGGLLKRVGSAEKPMQVIVLSNPKPGLATAPVAQPAPAPEPVAAPPAWYERWWVWAIVGGAAVALTTGLVVAAGSDDPPDSRDFTLRIR